MSVFSDIKNLFKKVGRLDNEFKKAAREVGKLDDKIEDAWEDAKKAVKEAARAHGRINWLKGEVKKLINECKEEVEEAILEKLPELIEDKAKDVLDDLTKALTKEGLEITRDVVRTTKKKLDGWADSEYAEEINKIGINLQIGPMTLAYENFYTRADLLSDSLDTWVNEPPALRRKPIMDMIEALAPDSVDFGIDFEFALGVGSDALGVGVSMSAIPTKLFLLIGDDILEELGVPE